MKNLTRIFLLLFISTTSTFSQSIQIISPLNNTRFHYENNYITIRWIGPQLSLVNTQFSTDNGLTWENIYRSFLHDTSHSINFGLIYSHYLIKITEINNPLNFDQITLTKTVAEYNYLSINNISMWLGSNGNGSYNPQILGNGFIWPKNEGTKAIFADGLLWGGKVNNEIRLNGNNFRQGLIQGNIINFQPVKLNKGIWKIRVDPDSESEDSIRQILINDYYDWPHQLGAPWVDINKDGIFTEGTDKPLFYGDEQIYFVANDLDTLLTNFTYGTNPLGLEIHVTSYAFDSTNFLSDVVFKKYLIINKSSETIEEMLMSYWADNDMGDANDDFVGCDTTLNLAYTWNSKNFDNIYGEPAPAVGHFLLQGPIVPSINDSAVFKNKWINGYNNLKMSSFTPGFKGSSVWGYDPPRNFEGALQLYNNILRGLHNNGTHYINPYTNLPDIFSLSGDPETGIGWYEGEGWPNGIPFGGDRRYYLNFGTFNMAPNDTQEVVIGIAIARGENHKNSVTKLKELVSKTHQFYINNIGFYKTSNLPPPVIIKLPETFELFQNYPNPFNNGTKIKYNIKNTTNVKIKIYDILGREILTLVNEVKEPNSYEINFNPQNLSSGIYIYIMEAGDVIQNKKMVYLK